MRPKVFERIKYRLLDLEKSSNFLYYYIAICTLV